jgi:hypothetical protein
VLGFSSLALRLRKRDDGWCTWHHRGGHVRIKLKMDGSIRWAASDCYSYFTIFDVLGPRGNLVL